jgi:uncharacterized protein YfaS (alpha-2-macroglobulin family)
MASPVVKATLDKTTYSPGDKIVLTVTYSDPDSAVQTITVTGTDSSGNPATATVVLTTADAVTLAVTDTGARTWAKVSDTGSVAVFNSVA